MITLAENFNLKNYNTFNLDYISRYFYSVNNRDQISELVNHKIFDNFSAKLFILSGGSNILLTKNFDGLMLHINTKGWQILNKTDKNIIVKVEAGEVWHDFVTWAVNNGYGGVENLALIPGKVGASPIQNIGAYGVEAKDVIEEVEFLNLNTLKTEVIGKSDCDFAYRSSIFKTKLKGQFIITSVTFKLSLNSAVNTSYGNINGYLSQQGITNPDIKDVYSAVIAIRQEKLPDTDVLGNAGSFFKNPIIDNEHLQKLLKEYPNMPYYKQGNDTSKLAAAWLIDTCGFKGKRFGNVGVYDKQALILVHYGDAQGSDIVKLAENIISTVYDRFNVTLSPEVNIIT
ncbi:MAG: UDP-N-acetylmuramate dehydrogenase [Lentimicrobiaceae bacterium]|nr:UDP-N-acetylmuramate dehydrogenase [Lentimicrobiaceae bacterium]